MTRAVADTSLFIGWASGRVFRSTPPDDIVTSVVTVGELRLGVLMAGDLEARRRRLATLELATRAEPLPVTDAVAERWAGLVATLRAAGRRMGLNDSWIAATALAHELPVATFDSDFDGVPGLEVIGL